MDLMLHTKLYVDPIYEYVECDFSRANNGFHHVLVDRLYTRIACDSLTFLI